MSSKALPLLGKFGFGTMSLTWTPKPKTVDDSISIMKYVCDTYNVRVLNGGIFYGPNFINLDYLLKFWEKHGADYPDLIVSIKGGINAKTLTPDGSRDSIELSIQTISKYFPPEKKPKILFEIARVDPKTPYKETIGYIHEFVQKGVIDGISLSEVGAKSIAAAAEVAPISCVEIEFSLMCQDIVSNGVLAELAKQNIPAVAYSPLCRGFLTDRTANNFDAFFELCQQPGDVRGHIDILSKKNFKENLKIVAKLQEFAKTKGVSLESLALSWIVAISESQEYCGIKNLPKILPIPSGSTPEKVDMNLGSIISLDEKDLVAIKDITDAQPVQGYRYSRQTKHLEFA